MYYQTKDIVKITRKRVNQSLKLLYFTEPFLTECRCKCNVGFHGQSQVMQFMEVTVSVARRRWNFSKILLLLFINVKLFSAGNQ